MIITSELPDLPPRPLTDTNRSWRLQYMSQWGRQNAVIAGRAHQAEYWMRSVPGLTVKTIRDGVEAYQIGNRALTVDDDTYLVLNDGQRYGSLLQSPDLAESVCVFYRSLYPEEFAMSLNASGEQMAQGQHGRCDGGLEFSEHLRWHDDLVSPRMQRIRDAVFGGERDEFWYEEQLIGLLRALLDGMGLERQAEQQLAATKPSTRRELLRRVRIAADFMHCAYAQELSLEAIAREAMLSKFHLIRLFKRAHGITPHEFLQAKRGLAAKRLLERSSLSVNEIAVLAGFADRTTLYRQLRRQFGAGPQTLRRLRPNAKVNPLAQPDTHGRLT